LFAERERQAICAANFEFLAVEFRLNLVVPPQAETDSLPAWAQQPLPAAPEGKIVIDSDAAVFVQPDGRETASRKLNPLRDNPGTRYTADIHRADRQKTPQN